MQHPVPPAPLRFLRFLPVPIAAAVAAIALEALWALSAASTGSPSLPLLGLDVPTALLLLGWSAGHLLLAFHWFRSAALDATLLLGLGFAIPLGIFGPVAPEQSLAALTAGLLIAAFSCNAQPRSWGPIQVSMWAATASILPLSALRIWQEPVPIVGCAGCAPAAGILPAALLVLCAIAHTLVFVRHSQWRPQRATAVSVLLLSSHVSGWGTIALIAARAAPSTDERLWFGLAMVAALLASCALYFAAASRQRARELARAVAQLEGEVEARRASEARERESTELVQRTLEHASLGFWVWDLATGGVELSQGAIDSFGRDDSLRSTSFAAMREFIHQEDAERTISSAFALIYGRGEVGSFDYRVVLQDGDVRWTRSRIVVWRDAEGRALRVSGVSIDTTEERGHEEALHDSEQRFRMALEQAPFPVMLYASDGGVILLNHAFVQQSGWNEEELRSVDDWTSRALGEALAADVSGRMRAIDGKQDPERAGPFEITSRSGESRLWQLDFVPLGALPDGRRLAMMVATDVTAHDLASELARSNHDLEQFAYIASHDLQEPLRMVASFVQLLEARYRGRLDDDADRFIHFAVDGARRMQQLINDLLIYSRAGRGAVPDAPVPAQQVLDEVVQNLQRRIDECGAQISRDALPALRGARSHFVQIFQNLVGNALKYRRDGAAPQIHVGCKVLDGRRLLFVRDDGIGFEPAQVERIFRPFQRLHEADQYPGSGIGLAIVRRIAARYGGTVWAESEPGAGSTFWIALPLVDDESEKPDAAA